MSKRRNDFHNLEGIFAPKFKKSRRCQTPSPGSSSTSDNSDTTAGSVTDRQQESVGIAIPPSIVYKMNVQRSKQYHQGSVYSIVPDCDVTTGKLKSGFVVVSKQQFRSTSSSNKGYIYTCSCARGIEQHERLKVTNKKIDEDFLDFYTRETEVQCVHAATAEILMPGPILPLSEGQDDADINNGDHVDQFSEDPLLVCVVTDGTVSLIQRNPRTKQLLCSCSHGVGQKCCHKKAYQDWCGESDITFDSASSPVLNTTSTFDSISFKDIPYPLPADLQQTYNDYETGVRPLPHALIPVIPTSGPHQNCPHGYIWDESDPVEEGWRTCDATIYKEGLSMETINRNGQQQRIRVYHRFCTGDCRCRLEYDGQKDLLFNLNNRDLVYYGVLFKYLHNMVESRFPLAAYHRSCQQSHSVLSGTRPISAGKLRLAWNGFARLLFVPSEELFQCPKCGAEPSIIICDGTTLGCNKLLLKSLPDDPVSTDGHIKGSSFVSRTFITDSTVRKLLQKYCTDCLSHNELSMLLGKLLRANKHSLATFIEWVHRNTEQASSVSCPEKYKKIMKDIAASGPACALFQGTTNEDLDYMKAVLQSNEPIFKTNYASVMNFIQRKFPIFVDFLTITRTEDSISNVSRDLLLDIIETGMQAFVAPGERVYSPADAEEMIEGTHCFPNLPKLHRNGRYAMDKHDNDIPCRATCRKFSKGHPTLSPGIFTIYCPHGICYGFEMMRKSESPYVPFSIFKIRFKKAPEIVIYDNACKLHSYCLNREPAFFKNTMFLVDRMHWHNHRSCARGYCMDTYRTRVDLKSLNSQVNEQANAGIARIKGQLAYMLPDNFMFHCALFLAMKNKKKIQQITA